MVFVIAALFVVPGAEEQFCDYEMSAASVMSRHGGKIERRIRVHAQDDATLPYEVHVVSFPDELSLQSYQRDPALEALAALRAAAIRNTVIWRGVEAPQWPE